MDSDTDDHHDDDPMDTGVIIREALERHGHNVDTDDGGNIIILQGSQDPDVSRWADLWRIFASLAAVLTVVTFWFAMTEIGRLRDDVETLSQQIVVLERTIIDLGGTPPTFDP